MRYCFEAKTEAMIPEPDYSDEETRASETAYTNEDSKDSRISFPPNINKKTIENNRFDESGFVLPKKIINPNLESCEKKNLHKEIKFNQKIGINVLNQKTELQKAMEKHKEKAAVREHQKEMINNPSPLQKAIDERAQRLQEKQEKSAKTSEDEEISTLNFQKVQEKFRSKMA